jgi:hypothetical protein
MSRPLTEAQAIKRFRKGRAKAGMGTLRVARVLAGDVYNEVKRPDSLFGDLLGRKVAHIVLDALVLYETYLNAAAERDG